MMIPNVDSITDTRCKRVAKAHLNYGCPLCHYAHVMRVLCGAHSVVAALNLSGPY
jgi:hypothetical protein